MRSHNIKIKYLFNVKSENMEYNHNLHKAKLNADSANHTGILLGLFKGLRSPFGPTLDG